MITCVIPFTGNKEGLIQLLVSLQPQLHPSDDIYIIDSSPDCSGLRIATTYGSTRCFIFVETGKYTWEEAVRFGDQSARENKQIPIYLNESYIISATLIQNLKRAIKNKEKPLWRVIETPYMRIPANFQWYYPNLKEERVVLLPYKKTDFKA